MKRIFICVVVCSLLFSLVGCSSSSSADDVAINYLNGLAEQDFDKMDKYSAVKYEVIGKAMVEQYMQVYSKTEAEIYELLLSRYLDDGDDIDMPKNFQEYQKSYTKAFQEAIKEQYGEKYSIHTTIISSIDVEVDDKNKLLEEASDYYDKFGIIISDIVDFSSINEIKRMKCKVYIKGTDDEDTQEFSIYVAKMKGGWKVLNIGADA